MTAPPPPPPKTEPPKADPPKSDAPKAAPPPRNMPAAPAPAPKTVKSTPKPGAPAPTPIPPPAAGKPAAKPIAPKPTPPAKADKPARQPPKAPPPSVDAPVGPKPAVPPKVEKSPPKSTPPAVVVKRPDDTKPGGVGAKPVAPVVNKPSPKPPVATVPPRTKPDIGKGPTPSGTIDKRNPPKVLTPGNGLVRNIPAAPRPVPPAVDAPSPTPKPRVAGGGPTVRRSSGLVPGAAAVAAAPVVFNQDPTFDSGLVRGNGLVRPIEVELVYGPTCGPSYVVNGYGYGDYPWRTTTYVSYSSGYCAPSYPRWPYYSSPFYGSPLRSAVIYTSYDPWCPPRYYVPCPPTYVGYCGPTYTYCPPTYCAPSYCDDDRWSFSFGFSGSSSWFGFGYSSGWWSRPYGYSSYDCWDPCYRPYRCIDPCAPGHGWWRRPVWGWSVYSCDPWSCAEPRGPVYLFPLSETVDATAYAQSDTPVIDAAAQLEETVYSTMRGRYHAAIEHTRDAVLSTPEHFAPGSTELDQYELQRAAWALTVYENPPRAAVHDKDAAFMVAALAALAGDHDRAVSAAAEARELGDDHPSTLRLIEQLALDEARADWGVQSASR